MTTSKALRSCAAALALLTFTATSAGAQPVAPMTAPPKAEGLKHLAAARELVRDGNAYFYGPLIMCYPTLNSPTQKIIKYPPATQVFDNLYFVGIGTVSAWVVKTDQGLIIIDTLNNPQEAEEYILGGMAKLGLNPNDVKYIVVTHGHGDHYGGAKFLQDKIPGAKVVMSELDYQLADTAAAGPRGRGVPAPRHDLVGTDGQVIKLGDTALTLYITPGHTPATLSMSLTVKDKGAPKTLVLWGGSASWGLNAADHVKYDTSIKRMEKVARDLKADGLFSNHSPLDDTAVKIETMAQNPTIANPYLIGTDEVVRTFRIFEECNMYHATK